MILPRKTLELKLLKNYRYIIAVDEVGMGSLAGPVVVCAAVFDKKFFRKKRPKLHWLRDSKLLSPKKREEFARELFRVPGLKFQICYSYPKIIDRINIYQAARLAMRRAVTRLAVGDKQYAIGQKGPIAYSLKPKAIILVDGPHKIPGLDIEQIPIVKGDRKIFAIACASIIAKVYRDRMMANYGKRFPDYGFERHRGYSTRLHRTQLTALGPTPIHRRSFTPVARLG